MIIVLRMGHRPQRDKRITTHVGLVARTFGANGIWIAGEDKKLEESLKRVPGQWGGEFEVRTGVNWRTVLKEWNGTIVHLTMYGQRLKDVIGKVPHDRDLLLVVGAEKVPREVYERADLNIAVGNQPHSEVAAVALFLDRYLGGKWEDLEFEGGNTIIPCERGKKVIGEGEE